MWSANRDYVQDNGWYRPAAAGGGGSPAWTATGNPVIQHPAFSGGASSYTFTSVSLGASPGRTYIGLAATINGGSSITGVTVGAVGATRAVTSLVSTETRVAEIWYADTTNSSDNIVVSISGASAVGYIGIAVGKITNVSSAPGTSRSTTYGFNADPQVTAAITIPSGGFGVVCLQADNDAAPTVNTGTLDYNIISGANAFSITLAHISTSGSQTPSISGFAFSGTAMAATPQGA